MDRRLQPKLKAGNAEILEVGVMLMEQHIGQAFADRKGALVRVMSDYLSGMIQYPQAHTAFMSLVGQAQPIERLKEIVEVPDRPIPDNHDPEPQTGTGPRRKMRSWSPYEDTRLLAGIYRYGVDNWAPISRFVGNGRTRAQCAQRWARGLNPRICKDTWDINEDIRLMQFVNLFGGRAWTKIAALMGNRSDVQCRYHYHQLSRDMSQLCQIAEEGNKLSPFTQQQVQQIKPFFAPRTTARFSMPSIGIGEDQHMDIGQRRASALMIPPLVMDKKRIEEDEDDREKARERGEIPDGASIRHLLNR